MTTDLPQEDDAFARTGMISPMGTLIDELKTKVDPDTAAAFRRKVNEAGMDSSGAIRDWVYMLVHGKTYTEICLDASKSKREALFGTGPNRDIVGANQ
ncbi:hypothetical protein [uncultured Rhodoferax sp.]|uniref:hypothetical protein n=1 Tax=uncultured Rhodoferax sp. TaxID=223188 RepID=UPI0025EECAF1|nr:hypothetical protein [uncultured Rhodoferax sp.]